ncbi:MAG: 2-succinyl-5-enolpyruvyl-6-hydroxy-3-cyclohexene-1-carboxylic-acid synthase [SAR324 cluster bacterium]|nr:2-succinyl-5-enolpyruvyl-6-hydroxy-3-cyclohexene-1-carboxylic-acid synthase [SAR324 cluster bacterium]
MTSSLLDGNLNLLWSSLIVSELVKNGIGTFFISPGYRNVPLIAALSQNQNAVKRLTIDERAAGFRALGYAKSAGKAGVLVCTSGTALSNYFPALIEACEDELPMIIISADRPPELVGSHANQSIEQTGIYGRFAIEMLNLPCPDESYPLDALLAKIDYLISIKKGPVQINCPFREPLLNPAESNSHLPEAYLSYARQIFDNPNPFTDYLPVEPVAVNLKRVEQVIQQTERGMVVIGRMAPAVDRSQLIRFIMELDWPVYCDIASGLRGVVPLSLQIPILDHPTALENIRAYHPQTILQFGTGLVSKHYYQTVLSEKTADLILVTGRSGVRDPSHRVNIKIPIQVDRFAKSCQLTPDRISGKQKQDQFLKGVHTHYHQMEQQIPPDEFSFLLLARLIVERIPENEALFLGNSISIRAFDALLFPAQKAVEIITNRGVSGIEGNLATSIGYAETRPQRITAVIGDISLLHDLNSLMLISPAQTPIILIVPNNGGGKIFDRLPARNFPDVLDPYLTTPHTMNFKHAAAQFNLDYRLTTQPSDFAECYQQALDSRASLLIEVSIDPERDLAIFKQTMIRRASFDL